MTVRLLKNLRDALAIPEEALIPSGKSNNVFVVQPEASPPVAERREVQIGVRRGFMDVIKAQGKKRKNGAADVAVKYIKKLYKLERHARKNDFSIEEIIHMRQADSKPVLEDF